MTPARLAQLDGVNAAVNRAVYQTDASLYGREDFWTDIEAAGRGDCEDYAWAKKRRLKALGWPAYCLRYATCRTERGDYHAVLLVEALREDGQGVGAWVLDNRASRAEPIQAMRHRGYRFDRVERQGGGGWVTIT